MLNRNDYTSIMELLNRKSTKYSGVADASRYLLLYNKIAAELQELDAPQPSEKLPTEE